MPISIRVELDCDYCEPQEHLPPAAIGVSAAKLETCFKQIREAGWKTYPAQNKAKCSQCCKGGA